jgi:Tfp pilus assembly protein PilF
MSSAVIKAMPMVLGLCCGATAFFFCQSVASVPRTVPETEQQMLQGQWRVMPPLEVRGSSHDTPVFGLNFKGDKLTFSMGDFEHDCRFTLSTVDKRKIITLQGPTAGQIKTGLYELSDGGRILTLALGRGDLCPESLKPYRLKLPYEATLSYWFLRCVKGEPPSAGNPEVHHDALWFNWLIGFRPPGRKQLQQFEEQARRQEHDAAIATLDKLMKDWPDDAEMHLLRGKAFLHGKKDYAAALKEFEKALPLAQSDPECYLIVAWLLAACPEEAIRNGKRALQMADKACKLTQEKMPVCLSARAAAYAELGKFPQAVAWEQKALALPEGYSGRAKEEAQERLKLYAQGKPYRR